MVTKAHWFDPSQLFYWPKGNNLNRVGPRGTKSHLVIPRKSVMATRQ